LYAVRSLSVSGHNFMKNKDIYARLGCGLGPCGVWSVLIFLAFLAFLAVPGSFIEARELTLGGINTTIENTVDQSVEDNVEESVEETVQDSVEDAVVEVVEEQIIERTLSLGGLPAERAVEQAVEESIEESVAGDVEDAIEDSLTEQLAADVEEDIEDTIVEELEETVSETVEEGVEETVSATIEESVAGEVEESVEESVAGDLEQSLESEVEEEIASSVEQGLESEVEEEIAENVEQGLEDGLETGLEAAVAGTVEEKLDTEIDEILEQIESEFEVDESRIQRGQWLVMAEPEVFEELAEEGYLFDTVTELPGLGLRLAEVAAPSSFDISEVRQGVVDVVGSDRAEVDLNHFYTAGEPEYASESETGIQPREAIDFPSDVDEMSLRIGMIDSEVDTAHPALAGAHIESRSFAPEGAKLPDFHGTAIASIIAAADTDYRGLAPSSHVYAAAVFEEDAERGEIASTVSLVRALDWLVSSGVDVINISLAGPPNRLLEAALARAAGSDVMILAAAGNGGPVARPMYPAAYDSVVAVTAVDAGGRVFRLANRGSYLDLSAPGVGMLHARAGGGYVASSGTSFAVPFAATAAARLRYLQPEENVLELLIRSAQDLGPPGRDEIYSYGLLRPAST
jgi:hypothetical protein